MPPSSRIAAGLREHDSEAARRPRLCATDRTVSTIPDVLLRSRIVFRSGSDFGQHPGDTARNNFDYCSRTVSQSVDRPSGRQDRGDHPPGKGLLPGGDFCVQATTSCAPAQAAGSRARPSMPTGPLLHSDAIPWARPSMPTGALLPADPSPCLSSSSFVAWSYRPCQSPPSSDDELPRVA
jgi:hypothetical protein